MNANSDEQNGLNSDHLIEAQSDNTLVVMFVDICGSTRMFTDFGNETALAKTSRCLRTLKAIIEKHQGKVVNTFGDGLLCTFPVSDSALRAALDFQPALREQDVAIHGGLHRGKVIVQENSIYGDTVNVASRLANLAKDDEILFSKDVVRGLSPPLRQHTRNLGALTLKGKTLPIQTYLLSSNSGTETALQAVMVLPELQQSVKLQLRYQGHTEVLHSTSADFTLGRLPGSGLTVASHYASRRHATIECQRGKFTLTDHSSNGSFIRAQGQQLNIVKRETYQLQGCGVISLGVDPAANREHLIEYCLLSAD